MGVNTIAGLGLVFSRNLYNASPTYQMTSYTISKSYSGTKIGKGDVVASAGSTTGYITLAADGASSILGIFDSLASYFDTNLQNTIFLQWWTGTASPAADVTAYVIDDPNVAYRAQLINVAWSQAYRGQNVPWITGNSTNGNGNPTSAGISTLCLNGSLVATTNTLAFRIMGTVGFAGGPQDPTNTNPWIEVCLNPGVSERNQATGL